MGLLGALFGGDKPNQKTIEKLMLRVKEPYAQPEYRREAMDRLLSFETPEAMAALLKRFTVVVQSPHWDEEEKRWLCDELASRGEMARDALRAYLAVEDNVAFAVKALRQVHKDDALWLSDIIAALEKRPPEDHRTGKGKTELIHQLTDLGNGRVVDHVLPYFDDHADEVQLAALDCTEKHYGAASADAQAKTTERLQQMVGDDLRSARVLRHIAGVMAALAIPVDASKPLAPAVAEDFVIKEGRLASSR